MMIHWFRAKAGGTAVAGVLIVAALPALAQNAPLPTQVQSIPALNADLSQVTVSGLSSGAFMAHQLHVAFSDRIIGAGIIAGGPYGCSGGSSCQAVRACMNNETTPARALNEHVNVFPPPAALEISQDRYVEKSYFARHAIPTTPFVRVDSLHDLQRGIAQLGLPCVLKTRRMGYDGKGQAVLRAAEQVAAAWQAMQGSALILEQFAPFDMEVSLLSVRGMNGELAFYPLVINTHREGILRQSIPVDNTREAGRFTALQQLAQEYATRVLTDLNYVGVLAIEFFVIGGTLLANEMAPRVHNSGHWTIEGAETSQFENHLRAIAGLPLGSTALKGVSAMVNIIGELPDARAVLSVAYSHLHLYDKAPRPGRKIGHITINAPDAAKRDDNLQRIRDLPLGLAL